MTSKELFENKELLKEVLAMKLELEEKKKINLCLKNMYIKDEKFLELYFIPPNLGRNSINIITFGLDELRWKWIKENEKPEKIIEAYEEIQSYREWVKIIINEKIQLVKNKLWSISSEKLITLGLYDATGYELWIPNKKDKIYYEDIPEINSKDGWKYVLFEEEFNKEFYNEYNKWKIWCELFINKMKRPEEQPYNFDLKKRIQELETKLENERDKTKQLEEQLQQIKSILKIE